MYDKKIQCKFTFSNAKKLLDVNVYMDNENVLYSAIDVIAELGSIN